MVGVVDVDGRWKMLQGRSKMKDVEGRWSMEYSRCIVDGRWIIEVDIRYYEWVMEGGIIYEELKVRNSKISLKSRAKFGTQR